MKIQSFAALAFLLSFGAVCHSQSFDQGYDSAYERFTPRYQRSAQLVKYYKPTQTYYGKGYVVRYGYMTTNPLAAGYSTTYARTPQPFNEYLNVVNPEDRREVTLTKASVKLPAREDLQSKRDIQPAETRVAQPVSKAETKVEPKADTKVETKTETKVSEPKH